MVQFLENNSLVEIGKRAKIAARELSLLSAEDKDKLLFGIKEELEKNFQLIIDKNAIDMENGRGVLTDALLDRLELNEGRLIDMANSITDVVNLDEVVGKVENMKLQKNGLQVGQMRVPIGVIAIIYEARPNVTLDTAILCIKSSNAVILRGGSDAVNSNIAIANTIRSAIEKMGYNPDFVQLIEDTDRKTAVDLMKLRGYVDLLIPRGSAGLINSVLENASVPVLETGVGNCHVYVDEFADIKMAINIIRNAKTQRTGVCNAMESLLVHKNVSDAFYKELKEALKEKSVIVHGSEEFNEKYVNDLVATEEDYGKEYLEYEMSAKVVDSIDEALDHIAKYSTHHSDVIVTENYTNAMRFLREVDSACVYVNASSRFTDGSELGMGAEMGISTQKLHARGPVGIRELTTTKYVILGNGQVRK